MDRGFDILERLLHATYARQKVIASNVANADTPDYKAKDLEFNVVLNNEMTEVKATHPKHIKLSGTTGEKTVERASEDGTLWGDRNNVELDIEMAKMTENALLYETGTKLLSTKIRMFRNALRGR